MGMKDQHVIEAILSGDRDAYEVLVNAHARALFRLAFRFTRNEADAEDVVQEALLRAFCKLSTFDARSSFGTWVYRITARCALDRIESRKRKEQHEVAPSDEIDASPGRWDAPDGGAGPERLLLGGEIAAQSELALKALTPVERGAFILRHYEEQTTEEIAASLGISVNAAKQAVFRAVKKIRLRMAAIYRSEVSNVD